MDVERNFYKIEFGILFLVIYLNCIYFWFYSIWIVIEIELVILYGRVDFFFYLVLIRNSFLRMEMLYLVRSLMILEMNLSSFCVVGNNEINE